MTYGIIAKNTDNDILIDSEFAHYHFAGKATLFNSTRIPAMSGGTSTAHSPSGPTGLAGTQVNGNIFKYSLSARANSNSPPPMCFIKPISTGSNAPYASVILTTRIGTNWEMWVIQTYGHSAPTLYCFLPLNEMSYAAATSSDDYGIQTFNSSNNRTYDSRILPLKVVGGNNASSPSMANTGGSSAYTINLSVNVAPLSFATGVVGADNTVPASDMMYYCPSIAHSCSEWQAASDGEGFQSQGYNSFFYAWSRADLWWCFYRSAFRINSGFYFQSSYSIYASGHAWDTDENKSGLLSAILAAALAFATFGASLPFFIIAVGGTALTAAFASSGTPAGFYYPYKNDSRNTANSNPFMISRASYYD
jgi:hypothetical protein